MSEMTELIQVSIGGVGLLIASILYSFGGRAGTSKLWRRLGSALVLGATVNALFAVRGLWEWAFLSIPLMLFGGYSLGYGADYVLQKIAKRAIYAAAIIFSGVVICFIIGGKAWWVLIPHTGVGAFSIYLGVKNPISATTEEFFVCLLLGAGLIMYPFI